MKDVWHNVSPVFLSPFLLGLGGLAWLPYQHCIFWYWFSFDSILFFNLYLGGSLAGYIWLVLSNYLCFWRSIIARCAEVRGIIGIKWHTVVKVEVPWSRVRKVMKQRTIITCKRGHKALIALVWTCIWLLVH